MKIAIILSAFVALGSAHMRLSEPMALRAPDNNIAPAGPDTDYEMIKPLIGAKDFPCKGYHKGFPTMPYQEPVATWAAGTKQSFTVMGNGDPADIPATHGGGSCQVSFSHDGGNTFRVIKSWIGGCVAVNDNSNVRGSESQGNGKMIPTLDFNVPADVPNGPILFAWTWFNTLGNREMYMNCASITISGGATETSAFDKRPEIFQANIDNGCKTTANTQVEFPEPGDDFVIASGVGVSIAKPEGSCAAGSGPSASGPKVQGDVQQVDGQRKAEVVAPVAESPAPVYDGPATTPEASAPAVEAPATTPAAAAAPSVAFVPVEAAPSTGGALTGDCSANGDWHCIDSVSFQRCVPGGWTVAQVVPPGTECTPGQGPNIEFKASQAKRGVGFSQPHVRRHAERHARL